MLYDEDIALLYNEDLVSCFNISGNLLKSDVKFRGTKEVDNVHFFSK